MHGLTDSHQLHSLCLSKAQEAVPVKHANLFLAVSSIACLPFCLQVRREESCVLTTCRDHSSLLQL